MNKENKGKLKRIELIKNRIIIIATFICFINLLFINNTNSKILRKEIAINNEKALEQEGQNYRLVTSADNVQVPVPKGYATSNIIGENYVTPEYQYVTIPHKGNYSELTWSSPIGEQYPWTQDENGIWISGNQGIPNSTSTLESEEFDYLEGSTLTINYTYSCQNSYNSDYFQIYLLNVANNIEQVVVVGKYGNINTSFNYITSNYTYTANDLNTGRYKIRAVYSKNSSIDLGKDSGYIKLSTYFKEDENGTETINENQKIMIHDGGFVIYQLTDEEIETNPNGTNIIINDTNKDISQTTRNQYVWIPVENIEDLLRTKMENNGIMQFGQGYIFNNMSATKETGTTSNYYREPRLAENYDKTKYNLQRSSSFDKRESFLNEQQEEFTRMIKSINKYKGFYIGRYETGDYYSHSATNVSFKKPRVVRYNENISQVTWYNSYKDLKRLSGKTEKYVETGMIWDTMWDHTIKWLNETDTRSYEDSGTWGNYGNNMKTVRSGGTSPAMTGGIETITYEGKTYSNSPTSSNNIFDLAGNVWEWTRSKDTAFTRMARGASYNQNSNGYRAYSNISNNVNYTYYDYGARGILLIKY